MILFQLVTEINDKDMTVLGGGDGNADIGKFLKPLRERKHSQYHGIVYREKILNCLLNQQRNIKLCLM